MVAYPNIFTPQPEESDELDVPLYVLKSRDIAQTHVGYILGILRRNEELSDGRKHGYLSNVYSLFQELGGHLRERVQVWLDNVGQSEDESDNED